MASRHLAAVARGPDDYRAVYDAVLAQVERPVILHWLGAMFDPALRGYWGARRPRRAPTDAAWRSCFDHAAKIDGIKLSLLDARARDSTCVGGCPRACGCTPATTSTTTS